MNRQSPLWSGKGGWFGESARLISTYFNRRFLGVEPQPPSAVALFTSVPVRSPGLASQFTPLAPNTFTESQPLPQAGCRCLPRFDRCGSGLSVAVEDSSKIGRSCPFSRTGIGPVAGHRFHPNQDTRTLRINDSCKRHGLTNQQI